MALEERKERTTRPYRPPALTHVYKTRWVPPERLQASPLRRTARSLLTSADRVGLPILRCWIKIERPAPASQERSRVIIPQKAERTSGYFRRLPSSGLVPHSYFRKTNHSLAAKARREQGCDRGHAGWAATALPGARARTALCGGNASGPAR
jgi:hypothetical protein